MKYNRTRTKISVVGNELKVQTSSTTNRKRPHAHKRTSAVKAA